MKDKIMYVAIKYVRIEVLYPIVSISIPLYDRHMVLNYVMRLNKNQSDINMYMFFSIE